MLKPTIKLITRPDPKIIARVAALEEEAFGRGGLNEWHLPVIARHGRLFVIQDDDRVIGAAAVIKDWAAAKAYLFDLTVARDFRGRGYSRLLMEKVIESLKGDGVQTLELTVAPNNREAVGLYERLGFVRGAGLADEYGKGQDRWAMTLAL